MTKRTPANRGQPTLPGFAARRAVRRVERAVGASIVAGRAGGRADRRWSGTETLAREIAAAIDLAALEQQPYAVAQLAPRLLDTLRELQLTPTAAADGLDPVTEFLRGLAEPEICDAPPV